MKATTITAYPAVFNPIPDGGYEVSFPDFPGCVTFGNTFEEAQEKASEVLSLWIEELVPFIQPYRPSYTASAATIPDPWRAA